MEAQILEEARKLGVNLLNGIGANSKMLGDYLYSKYGMVEADYVRNYRHTLDSKLIPVYGLELIVRVSVTDFRSRIDADTLANLKSKFEARQPLTYGEYEQVDWSYRHAIMDADPHRHSVRWSDFGRFFLRYEGWVEPITKSEIKGHLRKRRQEVLELAKSQWPARGRTAPSKAPAGVAAVTRAQEAGPKNLEKLYEELLKRQGYKSERNVKIAGPYRGEIDILATKENEALLVEFKDWNDPSKADIDELHVFRSKLQDARPMFKNKAIRAVFVSASGFTGPARTLALANDIETVEGMDLAKEFLSWGIVGITVRGNAYYVVGPLARQPAARYNIASRSIEIR